MTTAAYFQLLQVGLRGFVSLYLLQADCTPSVSFPAVSSMRLASLFQQPCNRASNSQCITFANQLTFQTFRLRSAMQGTLRELMICRTNENAPHLRVGVGAECADVQFEIYVASTGRKQGQELILHVLCLEMEVASLMLRFRTLSSSTVGVIVAF